MQDIRFLETAGDIFVGGKNHGKKHRASSALKLEWNNAEKRAELTWNNETGWIFIGNISVLVPGKEVALPPNEHRTEHVEGRRRAQVSSPMGHVFEGPGHGKTGKSK